MPSRDVVLRVTESARHGAPMTMSGAVEERDLEAIAAMGGCARACPCFHLDRDVDFVHTRSRQSGCSPVSARRARGSCIFSLLKKAQPRPPTWSSRVSPDDDGRSRSAAIRDPSGARVGALLQALIAREPAERRPTIRAWFRRASCLRRSRLPRSHLRTTATASRF